MLKQGQRVQKAHRVQKVSSYVPIHILSMHPSMHEYIHLCIRPSSHPSVHPSICLPVLLSIRPSIHHLSIIHPPILPYFFPSIFSFIHLLLYSPMKQPTLLNPFGELALSVLVLTHRER